MIWKREKWRLLCVQLITGIFIVILLSISKSVIYLAQSTSIPDLIQCLLYLYTLTKILLRQSRIYKPEWIKSMNNILIKFRAMVRQEDKKWWRQINFSQFMTDLGTLKWPMRPTWSQPYQTFFFVNEDFSVFFAIMLGHFNVQTVFSRSTNTQA